MHTDTEIFLATPTYNTLVERLADLASHLVALSHCLGIEHDEIKVILGEVADIWPASIMEDVRAMNAAARAMNAAPADLWPASGAL